MKVKVNEPILDLEGNKIPVEDGFFTVRMAINSALNYVEEGVKQLAEEKVHIYDIAKKLYNSSEVDFTLDELKLIKDKADIGLPFLSRGRLLDIIDPQPSGKSDKA